jgi:hypothetical protein
MRMRLLAAAAVIGFGIAAASTASAAPVYGNAPSTASAAVDLKENVWWRRWGYRRYGYYGYGRGWCYWHPYRC